MKKLLIAVAAATAILGAASPAFPATYTFDFSGTAMFPAGAHGCTASPGSPCVDTFTGSFTIDTSQFFPLTALNISLLGNVWAPDTFSIPTSYGGTVPPISGLTGVGGDDAAGNYMFVGFTAGLPSGGGDINYVELCFAPGPSCYNNNIVPYVDGGTASGSVTAPVATPLPAALPLFASGLGAMGLFGWRRKRKAQAVAA